MIGTITLHIKNMVCPRCVLMVKGILENLSIPYNNIVLGQAGIKKRLTKNQYTMLAQHLQAVGLELLEPGKSMLISKIKTAIIEQVHHNKEPLKGNFSTFLSEQLHHEYTYLSRLFSSVEGITIEKYIAQQKIEKVKEHLIYNASTLSEIAIDMNYSNVAHLSSQFKKETGMTPTQFKAQANPNRQSIDSM